MVIQVSNVVKKLISKNLRNTAVIDDVSLELCSGSVYGFSGANGSGKTMLMRIISGLLPVDKGEVLIDGKKIGKDIDFPPSIGILIENPAFMGGYSGFDNLKYVTEIKRKVNAAEISETIKRVGLNPDDRKPVKKYSLGMKQRLGIAMAVMGSPDLIILDEPTNALDTTGIERLRCIIDEERRRGALIIVACHDKNFLDSVSDRVFTLEEGKLIR